MSAAGFWLAMAAIIGSSGAAAETVLTSDSCKLTLPAVWMLSGDKAKLADGSIATLEVTFDPSAFVTVLKQRSNVTVVENGERTIVSMSHGGVIVEIHGVSSGVGPAGKACHVEISIAGAASVAAARALASAVRHP